MDTRVLKYSLFASLAAALTLHPAASFAVSLGSYAAPALASADQANTAPASPVPDSPAAQFVAELGQQALTSLTAKNLSSEERSTRVRDLLTKYFDIQTIGRFVLGTHWAQANDAQRQEYLGLFENMIVQTYTRRFSDYSGQSFKIKSAAPNDAHDTMVSSVIVQTQGPPVNVDWRVRDENGTLKIVDVLIENVSMSITQRADFDAVIQDGGGGINALLASLKKRTQ